MLIFSYCKNNNNLHVHEDSAVFRKEIVATAADVFHVAEGMSPVADENLPERGLWQGEAVAMQIAQGLLQIQFDTGSGGVEALNA